MADLSERLRDMERRMIALETEGIDEGEIFRQILKLYADIEVEVVFRYWLHRYRKCGDSQPLNAAVCGANTFL